ncbi:hypothetical protein BCR33DRAFT_733919 [Rhizoclosmatium globosum]|uniref:F-box domain-containing protein n=1 Tax=Rhizoclosmatium globosum TaxID=329046 RepID=A0A1Y2CXC3_9FUNG|nr:hypothetical protein BCR33DRAFT_733919 [Rhizoclosmatium globosum]|eukprot:ORY51689.1 hypothetical protein BCR33DRAFT_733919 [Rhizoclosmatium globosum]
MLDKLPWEILGKIQLLVRLEDAFALGRTRKALLPVLTDKFMAKKHIDTRRKLDGPGCCCDPGDSFFHGHHQNSFQQDVECRYCLYIAWKRRNREKDGFITRFEKCEWAHAAILACQKQEIGGN